MFYIDNSLKTESRLDMAKFFKFDGDNFDPLGAYMMTNIMKLPEQGRILVKKEEARPDLLSYRLYQDTQYWWVLMIYNSILDINELKSGTEIRYPSVNLIEYLYERASILDKTT